jgi:hypothetical protein
MGRLRDIGRDAAFYFGVGEGSEHRGASQPEQQDADWWQVGLIIVPVLLAAFFLRRVLGFEDDVVGFLVVLGLVLVLAPIWALILRAVHSAHGNR